MPPYFMRDRFINPGNGGNILQITIHRLIGLNHLKQRPLFLVPTILNSKFRSGSEIGICIGSGLLLRSFILK